MRPSPQRGTTVTLLVMTLSRPWDPFSPHLQEPETLSTEPVVIGTIELPVFIESERPGDDMPVMPPVVAQEPMKTEPAPEAQPTPKRTRGTRAGSKTAPRKRLSAALKKLES